LAKVASKRAKKDLVNGVFDLSSPLVQNEVLRTFPIRDVWGIGARTEVLLKGLGIYTALQFREMDLTLVRRQMGVVGERMCLELQGIRCLPLEEEAEAPQSITCSRSFGKIVTEIGELAEALSTYAASACEKLRAHQCCAQAVCVFLEARVEDKGDGAFRQHSSTVIAFPIATNDTPQVIRAAVQSLPSLYRSGMRYKKCGIVLLDLIPETSVIPDLFLGGPDPKRQRLAETVDALNDKYGKNALFYGAMGCEPEWKMRSESRTPRYTTSWDELPIINADRGLRNTKRK
jgi:DNA polymerase V